MASTLEISPWDRARGTRVEERMWHIWSIVLCWGYDGGGLQTLLRIQTCPPSAKVTCQSRVDKVSLAWGEASEPLDLSLASWDLLDVEHHQAYVDNIGGDANDAEIIEHKE